MKRYRQTETVHIVEKNEKKRTRISRSCSALQIPEGDSDSNLADFGEYEKQFFKNYEQCGQDLNNFLDLVDGMPSLPSVADKFARSSNSYQDCFFRILNFCQVRAKKVKRNAVKPNVVTQNVDSIPIQMTSQELLIVKIVSGVVEKCPTKICLAKCISIFGQAGHLEKAVSLYKSKKDIVISVNDAISQKGNEANEKILQAVLASCVPTGEWNLALKLLTDSQIPLKSQVCNLVLNTMRAAHEVTAALELLKNMIRMDEKKWPKPDRNSFLYVLNILIDTASRQNSKDDALQYVDKAYVLLNDMIKCSNDEKNLHPSKPEYSALEKAYNQHGDFVMMDFIRKCSQSINLLVYPDPNEIRLDSYSSDGLGKNEIHLNEPERVVSTSENLFAHWHDGNTQKSLVKHGRGRFAYWAYATYQNETRKFTVALKPHREPSKNGIKIVLYDNLEANNACSHGVVKAMKVGYLLMINSVAENKYNTNSATSLNNREGESSLLGMYLDPSFRKEKLSKIFLALWIDLCLKANLVPKTGVINKPLLALTLQNTFNLVPVGFGGFDVEIMERSNNSKSLQHMSESTTIELVSPSTSRSLQGGAFSSVDLLRENIQLVAQSGPSIPGRVFRLGCSLGIDDSQYASRLQQIVDHQVAGEGGNGRLAYENNLMPWSKILLGT